jgi:predicted Zn-ribbon and HTH transcriptional regulator
MDIQAEKIELMKLLLTTDNPSILESIKQIFKKEKTADFWDELSVSEKKEINQGIAEIERGEKISYESFLKKIS